MKNLILTFIAVFIWQAGFAHIYDPKEKKHRKKEVSNQISLREACDQPTDKFYQSINNVRAILTNGGDTWTNNQKGRYVVPKKENSEDEVSSLYSGAVWIGGIDPAGNLKIAASDYRDDSHYDFFAGPLDENGTTDKENCERWNIHFKVLGKEIDQHKVAYEKAKRAGKQLDCDSIPDGVKYWPAKGNPYFYQKYNFKLPANHDLAPFFDQNEDTQYDPCDGDYPIIHIEAPEGRGECPPGVYADEMFFWVYNDDGGGRSHTKSQGKTIHMEVQVEAFAWTTNDEINDMTFQRYKLINKAITDIGDCYFAWWVDPDLGCYLDDYIGCVPPPVNLMYVYNMDALDGSDGCSCDRGINTYCDRIPIIGVDYFRGPLAHFNYRIDSIFSDDSTHTFIRLDTTLVPIAVNESGDTTLELGMTSFIYFNGQSESAPIGTLDPQTDEEYYRYLTGYWKDGTKITRGGSGYNVSSDDTVKYVFPDPPNDPNGWSMASENLPYADRRTVQGTGPFVLKPGDVNELIIGVPWVPNQVYPKPALDELLVADELAQSLFDNCFKLQDGPDAPDIDIVELDQQLVLILSNDTITSNNGHENFKEIGLKINKDVADDYYYRFEGYQVYQLYNGDVSPQELDDFDKARLIFQADLKNGISTLYNWRQMKNPSLNGSGETIFIPEKKVAGLDQGLKHVINVTEDQFAEENPDLINHKPYYFMAIAYETNNYKEFEPSSGSGQREPYFPGRRNVKIYKGVPRHIAYTKLNIAPEEGPKITRVEGIGISNNFVEISQEAENSIVADNVVDNLVYAEGAGPFKVEVFSPFDVKDKQFKIELFDDNMDDGVLDETAYWLMTDLETGKTYKSDTTINVYNQQVIFGEGFAVTVAQSDDVFSNVDETNGIIGSKLVYTDPEGADWMNIIGDDSGVTMSRFDQSSGQIRTWDVTNYIKTGNKERDQDMDPKRALNNLMSEAPFVPFLMTEFYPSSLEFYVSPAAREYMQKLRNSCFIGRNCLQEKLNNVDIVFTSDKSKWSRCVVVEESYPGLSQVGGTFVYDEIEGTVPPEGDAEQFQLRQAPSVSKDDNDGDGLPDPDGDGIGMGWFPGYAIDVETGERLNIFFGEASIYGGTEALDTLFRNKKAPGRDMMFNPTSDGFIKFPGDYDIPPVSWNFTFGGMHMVYVTNTRYNECADLRTAFEEANYKKAKKGLKSITWTSLIMASADTTASLLSYSDGLIPNETKIKIRVNNPYQIPDDNHAFLKKDRKGYGTYLFDFTGKTPGDIEDLAKDNPLDDVNVVPNPYYAYSEYETSQFNKQVKITNLPGKCSVTIYSIDGKFIREYKRDERGIDYRANGRSNPAISHGQSYPDLVWDLKNHKGIPVASGVYLIHIVSDELKAEKTIKWFGVNREFDPTGL